MTDELKFCDLLPPQFRLPEEDPNFVFTPIFNAFCEMETELIKPAIVDLSNITNIDKTRAIDIILTNLGNPFPFFILTESKKRSLARTLVPMYRKKGTAVGIEQALLFFLQHTARVVDFSDPGDVWVLGESELGEDTFLAPSTEGPELFFFVVEFDVCLTDVEKDQATRVIDFMKPGWTSYVIIDCINPPIPTLPLVEGFEDSSWLL